MNSAAIPYLACKIDAGKCAVIEAAAGTGKTYNITNIVARIIMERSDVSIDQMVIVTFTRAAAGELKNRISQPNRRKKIICRSKKKSLPHQRSSAKTIPMQKS